MRLQRIGRTMSLQVRYGADVPPAIAQLIEHHARATGLSLAAIEIIGASLDFAEAFIIAAEDGHGLDHAARLGLAPPQTDATALARWQAEKLFG
jgi:hypothetical protein